MSNLEPKPSDFPRPNSNDVTIGGLDLVDTCTSHPEQYDVFAGSDRVGYIRLRCGRFYARRANNLGIDWTGEPCLELWIENHADSLPEWIRMRALTQAVEAINARLATPRCEACGGDTLDGICRKEIDLLEELHQGFSNDLQSTE